MSRMNDRDSSSTPFVDVPPGSDGLSRRNLLAVASGAAATAVLAACATPQRAAAQIGAPSPDQGQAAPVSWITTTKEKPWQTNTSGMKRVEIRGIADLNLLLLGAEVHQTIDGFGGTFNELGWQALSALETADRQRLMEDFFAPGAGANLSICRMPIGATDLSLDWYSHNEVDGDFEMKNFSISRDQKLLIPYIKAAREVQPNLSLWASPWSPPTWMKTNKFYATASARFGQPSNGIRTDQVRSEGMDVFIQEERYFRAYALYFQRFIEAYKALGIPIGMVMPQNEFNSAQIFPSCPWTPEGLARFLPYLGEAMAKTGTDVFFGTLERSDPNLFEKVYADPRARSVIKGVAAQWAGRKAIPFIHHAHPELKIYQSEQECGDGQNDWRFARYSWQMMRDFMRSGASAYDYWNIAIASPGLSSWGWPQNAFVTVDANARSYTLNHDYYIFKHASHFVKAGAKRIGTVSYTGYDNALAFRNPDGKIVVIIQNDMSEQMPMNITNGVDTFRVTLPADSLNTLVL